MGNRNRLGFRSLSARSFPWLFLLVGAIYPASAQAQSQSELQISSEQWSRACVEQVAQARAEQSQIEPALATCQQAVALTQLAGNSTLQAYSLGNLGILALQQQEYSQALNFFQQALSLAETLSDPSLTTRALMALGTTYSHLEQPQQALQYYQQALTWAETHSDIPGMGVAQYNLGLIYDQTGAYQQSVDAYQNAATLAQANGDPILEAYALSKLKIASQALAAANEQASRL
jgi:tetratricopeptide (TPR) repeat protein